MNYPKNLRMLIENFKKLPGVGEKTAERYALSILDQEIDSVEMFSKNIIDTKKNTKFCIECGSITEEDICNICTDTSRNKNVICVVEKPKNVILFEKMGSFNGLYHVLDGLISPLDDVNPDDINISQLLTRIEQNEYNEVILALRPDIEGETTMLYIKKMLEGHNIKVTKIAQGVPIGVDISYIDEITIIKAFENRNDIV